MSRRLSLVLVSSLSSLVLAGIGGAQAPPGGDGGPPPLPPARAIPGINTEDPFPRGCVDCHIVQPGINLDVRISTLMQRWTEGVDPRLLARAQAAAPRGVTLTGRHPVETAALADIPAACLACHGRESDAAPQFAKLLHSTHLSGGDENHFMTLFQGQCTYCHKLDPVSGQWSIPSGAER